MKAQLCGGGTVSGYEIHMGESRPLGEAEPRPLAVFDDGGEDGYIVDDKCMGTYIHGILDNPSFVDFLLRPYAEKMAASRHLTMLRIRNSNTICWQTTCASMSI